MLNLSNNEHEKLMEITVSLSDPKSRDKLLNEQFANQRDEILAQIKAGVADFNESYNGTMDSDTVCKRLEKNMLYMSPSQQYLYLSNLILAVTQMCGNVIDDVDLDEYNKTHRIVLEAIKNGSISKDSEQVANDIKEMLELICENYSQFSFILVKDSPYEKLLNVCAIEDPEKIQAIAVKSQNIAIDFATALYILQQQGELPSLGGEEISPYDMGVMAAGAVELDAAYKSDSWENAKDKINKVAKTMFGLLISTPSLVNIGATITIILALFTSFSNVWLLIGGAVMFANAVVHTKNVNSNLASFINKGVQKLDSGLDKVRDTASCVNRWFKYDLLPILKSARNRFCKFINEKFVQPVIKRLLKVFAGKDENSNETNTSFAENTYDAEADITEIRTEVDDNNFVEIDYQQDDEDENDEETVGYF